MQSGHGFPKRKKQAKWRILHTFSELIALFMKGTHLGEFEELVLLTIASLVSGAYSVARSEERRVGKEC